MENKTIRIALSAVLIYLIFEKTFDILAKGFSWINRKFIIENNAVLILIIAILGIVALFVLFRLYSIFLKKGPPEKKHLYHLILIAGITLIAYGTLNYFYHSYFLGFDPGGFQQTYIVQAMALNITKIVISIIGLVFFLWKIKNTGREVSVASEV